MKYRPGLHPELWTLYNGLIIKCRVFPEKAEAQITGEIQAIIRQITASITFLPLLSDSCTWMVTCGCWINILGACDDAYGCPLPRLKKEALNAGTIDLLAYTDRECEVPKEWCVQGPFG